MTVSHDDITRIEKVLQTKLTEEFSTEKSSKVFSDYLYARSELLNPTLSNLREDDFSSNADHTISHITSVFDNISDLLGDSATSKLNWLDLYLLCISVLFHETGDIESKRKYTNQVAKTYDYIRKKNSEFAQERTAVLSILGAHIGFCDQHGQTDMITTLSGQGVFRTKVDFRPIAAMLRFADELAEGSERISKSLVTFKKESIPEEVLKKLFEVAHYTIERNNSRIELNYSIRLEAGIDGSLLVGKIPLKQILETITDRITKLNEERIYCRYYCDWLEPYKELSVKFEFIHGHEYVDLDVPHLVINDLVIPGVNSQNACEPHHSAKTLISKLEAALTPLNTNEFEDDEDDEEEDE